MTMTEINNFLEEMSEVADVLNEIKLNISEDEYININTRAMWKHITRVKESSEYILEVVKRGEC